MAKEQKEKRTKVRVIAAGVYSGAKPVEMAIGDEFEVRGEEIPVGLVGKVELASEPVASEDANGDAGGVDPGNATTGEPAKPIDPKELQKQAKGEPKPWENTGDPKAK